MVERVQMAILQSFGKDGEIDKDKLIENLQKVEGIDKGSIPSDSDFDYPLTIVVGGHEITVDAEGDAYIEGEEGGNTNTNPGGNTHPGGNTGGDNTNTNPGGNTNTGGENGTGGGNTNTNPGGNTNTGGENGSGDTNTTNEIEVPDASVDGIIEVSDTTWSNGTASITISKGSGVDSSLKMQYKKSTESDDKYVTVNGNSETISGLNDGEVVIVRLTDGHDKYGGVKTINIEDGVKPNVTITLGTTTENSISVTVNATDGESGMPATPTYKYYIKKSSEGSYSKAPEETNDETHTFEGLESDEIYDIKVEVADNAGNIGSGEQKEVKTLIIIPDANDGNAIKVDGPNWNQDGTASITITKGENVDSSLYIEYKEEGDSDYKRVEGDSITGITSGNNIYIHLTDGTRDGVDRVIEVKDSTLPTVTVNKGTITENSIAVTVNATDGESGIPSPATYKYYIKKSSEGNYSSTPTNTNNNSNYTFNSLEADTTYDIRVEVDDNAGNTGAGELERISTLVAIPDANDESALIIQGPTWNNGTASLTVKKGESVSASLDIEYKKEGEETYKRLQGDTISNIANGEKIYIHLTDGTRAGADKEIDVSESTAPTAEIKLSATTMTTKGSIIATITQTDDPSGIDIANSRYVFSTERGTIGTDAESYTGGSFTQNPQDIILNASTAGNYYLHVLTVDKAGNKKETVSQRVTVTEPEPDEPEEPEKLLQFGEVQWNGDMASVTINKLQQNNLDIQYKIKGVEQWYTIIDGGTIENLYDGDVITACLTDGTTQAYEITLEIKAPDVTVPSAEIKFSLLGMEPGESITATVTQTDDDSGVNITASRYVFNTVDTKIGTDESLYTGGNFTETPENIILNGTDEEVYYLHVLTVDNSGNKEETVSEPVTVIDLPGRAAGLVPLDGNAEEGIVARDENYNEWVWIEVPKTIFTTATSDTDYTKIYNDMKTYTQSYSNSSYTDTYIAGSGNFASQAEYDAEKQKMLQSVYDNGGFWISRYEIGTDNAAEAVAANTATVTKAESKQGLYPIVNKSQSQAQQIVKTIDNDASLMFGIQWDLTLKFLETKGMQLADLTTNSASWGNYTDAVFTPDRGKYNLAFGTADNWQEATGVQHSSIAWCITTGAADYTKKMNIYDLAGNVREWTLESTNGASVVSRGGMGASDGTHPAGERNNSSVSNYDEYKGIRAAMYVDTSNQADDGTIVGKIQFGNLSWNEDYTEATVTVSKTDENDFTLQYKVNDGGWMNFASPDSGEIMGLKDKDVVTACLYDGTNRGYYATLNVVAPGDTAEDVASNPSKYYGQYVDYQPSNGNTEVKWKIFYAGQTPGKQTNNIYLIADDYISSTYAPKGKGGTKLYTKGIYKVSFADIIQDYSGSSDITNSLVRPWITFLKSYPSSTNRNMKAVAYMLDTKVWSTFTDSEGKAEYAIGGPTLDLFCASYNQKYSDKTMQYKTYPPGSMQQGYEIKWSTELNYHPNTGIDGLPTNDGLYVINSTSKADSMWLASPFAGYHGQYYDYEVMIVTSYGAVASNYYNGGGTWSDAEDGLRPIVCLKSDVKLQKLSDGTYRIK